MYNNSQIKKDMETTPTPSTPPPPTPPPTTNVSSARATIERKTQIMRITLGVTILTFFTFLITLTSSYWVVINYPADFYSTRKNKFIGRSNYGIIWECIDGVTKGATYKTTCDYHQSHIQNTSIPAEVTLVGLIRTMISFSVIHILLIITTFLCGLYSIREYRYTYKRLTGMLYILSAASLVVCLEVLSLTVRHLNTHLPDIYPPGTTRSYGVCYILAWLIFVVLIVSAFIFFACSRKLKGTFDEGTEEEALANQRVDLGRSFRH